MSFELCFRARETADDDRRPLPSWEDAPLASLRLPAFPQVNCPTDPTTPITDANVCVSRKAYDAFGRKTVTTVPDGTRSELQIDDLNAGTWTFGYDEAGNLAWHQDPRGNRFAFGYDDGNRLIWEDCESGPTCGPEIEVRYHYDSPATWENGEGFFPAGIVDHDGIELPQTHVLGRLAWVQDRGRRTYTSYDARGEVVAQAKNLHGFAMLPDENAPEVLKQSPVGNADLYYVSTRELDDVGRVRHETLVDGTELDYTYDRRGLLATLSGVYQDRALTFVQAVTYDLQGRRVAARLGGGIRETKTYNQMGRTLEALRVLVDETETITAEVLHLAYTYDRVGRLTSQTDLRADGLRMDGTSAPTVKTYTYDGQGQLLTSEERTVADDTLVRRMRYDYDVLGNIVEKHTTRCVETTSPCTEQDDPTDEYYTHWFGTATYHGDQLVSADGGDGNTLVATYDIAGNMETLAVTRGGQPYFTHTYTWDEQNRLASAVGTGQLFHGGQGVVAVAGYAYDNGGARIAALRAKTFMGVELEETLYVDPSFEIRNGEYTTYIHDSKGRLARLLPIDDNIISKITWLHADHLGSTSVVTSDDGTFIEETKYLPYGAVQSTHRPDLGIPYEPYGFTGKEPERDFGILYFGARYYNPHLARWISPDPLFLHVTSETAEKDQNGYCYASNDPVNRMDIEGNKSISKIEFDVIVLRTSTFHGSKRGTPHCSTYATSRALTYISKFYGGGIQVIFDKEFGPVFFQPPDWRSLLFEDYPRSVTRMLDYASMVSLQNLKNEKGIEYFKTVDSFSKKGIRWSPDQRREMHEALFGNRHPFLFNWGVKEGDVIFKRVAGNNPAKGHVWYVEDRFQISTSKGYVDVIQLSHSADGMGIKHKFVYNASSDIDVKELKQKIYERVGAEENQIQKFQTSDEFINDTEMHINNESITNVEIYRPN